MEFNTKIPSDMKHAYGQLKAADLSVILFKGNLIISIPLCFDLPSFRRLNFLLDNFNRGIRPLRSEQLDTNCSLITFIIFRNRPENDVKFHFFFVVLFFSQRFIEWSNE